MSNEIKFEAFGNRPQAQSQTQFDYTHLTAQEIYTIKQIVFRLRQMCEELDPIRTAQVFDNIGGALGAEFCTAMDIATIHVNDRRIKLFQLLCSDSTDFRADLMKIVGQIDREKGRLPNDCRLIFEENKM